MQAEFRMRMRRMGMISVVPTRRNWVVADRAMNGEDSDALAFARNRLGFEPDEKQAALLTAERNRLILNCSRQWGKSTVTAAKVLHRAWSRPKSMIVVVSPTERQSGEFLMKVKEFACRLGVRPRGDGVNRVSLLLPNGSRIVGLPGREGTSRGYSAVSLMIVDEAAKVLDELYYAVQPMLATTDGDLWLLSTPRGARGFFWEVWTRGDAEWERVSVKATECPRIPASFLEKQKRDYPDWRYRQEYLCEFSETEEALFDREMLMRAIRADGKPLWGPGVP